MGKLIKFDMISAKQVECSKSLPRSISSTNVVEDAKIPPPIPPPEMIVQDENHRSPVVLSPSPGNNMKRRFKVVITVILLLIVGLVIAQRGRSKVKLNPFEKINKTATNQNLNSNKSNTYIQSINEAFNVNQLGSKKLKDLKTEQFETLDGLRRIMKIGELDKEDLNTLSSLY